MLSLGAIFNKLGNRNHCAVENNNNNNNNNNNKEKSNGNIGSISLNSRRKVAKPKLESRSDEVFNSGNGRGKGKDMKSNKNKAMVSTNAKTTDKSTVDTGVSSIVYNAEDSVDATTTTASTDILDMDIDKEPKTKKTRYNHNDDSIDVHQHNARPKDLDREMGALKRPKLKHELPSIVKNIFTETSFRDLGMYLPPRMVNILEGSVSDANPGTESETTPVSTTVEINNSFKLHATTKIQSVTIPMLLMSDHQTLIYNNQNIPVSNKILIKSQTGSGKTLSYLIPIVTSLMKINDNNVNNIIPFHGAINRTDGVRALILVPTRELCNQVANSCNKLVEYCCKNCVVGIVTGGEKRKSEKARIRKGIVILIATPGRFLDHLRTTESLNMSKCIFIVLDEVDKLLELGESTYIHSNTNDINNHNALNEIIKILLSGDMQTLLHNNSVDKDKKMKKIEQVQKRNTRVEKKWGASAVLKEVEEVVDSKELNISLQEKWKQHQFLADRCVTNNKNLKLIMVTATLTQLVKRMASKILINNKMQSNMILLDGETDAMHYITNSKTIDAIGGDSGLIDGSVVLGEYTVTGSSGTGSAMGVDTENANATTTDPQCESQDEPAYGQGLINGGSSSGTGPGGTAFEILHRKRVIQQQLEVNQQRGVTTGDGCISFLDEDTIPEDCRKLKQKQKHSSLAQGENIADALPDQLSQYYMVVPCKWRLAALLSFLKTHSNEKVIVFFSTCDSVDYHALLLKAAGDFETKHKSRFTDRKEPIFEGSTWPLDFEEIYNHKQNIYSDARDNDGYAQGLHRIDEWNDYTSAGHKSHSLKSLKVKSGQDKKVPSFNANDTKNDVLEPLHAKFKSNLISKDTNIYRLHGNVPNLTRQTVYKEFCKPSSHGSILLCTDVAARGLDLPDVDWIVQYDTPTETIDYVHRIGRTARKGASGSSLLFLLPNELPYVQLLSSHGLSSDALSLQHVFLQTSEKYMNYESLVKTYTTSRVDEVSAVIIQKRMEAVAASNNILTQAAKQAFRSFVRAYSTHTSDYSNPTSQNTSNSSSSNKAMLDYTHPFQVYNLHLGHVAKSFGLTEHPKNIRGSTSLQDDVIGQIFNCHFSAKEKPAELKDKNKKTDGREKDKDKFKDKKITEPKGKIDQKDQKDQKGKKKSLPVFEQRIVPRDSNIHSNNTNMDSNDDIGDTGGSGGSGGVLDANGNEIINVKQIIADKRKYQHSAVNTGAPMTQKIRAITSQSANVTKVGRFHRQQSGITNKKQSKTHNKSLSEFI